MNLVELLSVIAIFGVLVAILIPVSMGVRKKADRSKCFNNLRQLNAATLLYVQDKGAFPDWELWPMSELEGGTREYWYQRQVPGHVPGVETITTSPVIDRQKRSWSPTRTNYAMNLNLSNHRDHGIHSVASIEEPSRVIHFTYGWTPSGVRSDGTYFFTKFVAHLNSGNSPIRHDRYYDDGYANLVYFDGSVDRISRDEGIALNRINDEESRLFWKGSR